MTNRYDLLLAAYAQSDRVTLVVFGFVALVMLGYLALNNLPARVRKFARGSYLTWCLLTFVYVLSVLVLRFN